MSDIIEGEVVVDNPQAIARADAKPMTLSAVKAQVNTIQKIMNNVMQEGQHYGTVKGCGPKPFLFQPGAQKIALTFRLSPTFEVAKEILDGGHREYEVTCTLLNIGGLVVAQGVGVGSTMESKHRYRWQGYGDNKKRVENDNPADQYNTVKKMASKRAYVHAVLNATAASDIFTQDEDYAGEPEIVNPKPKKTPPKPAQSPKKDAKPKPDTKPTEPTPTVTDDSSDIEKIAMICQSKDVPYDDNHGYVALKRIAVNETSVEPGALYGDVKLSSVLSESQIAGLLSYCEDMDEWETVSEGRYKALFAVAMKYFGDTAEGKGLAGEWRQHIVKRVDNAGAGEILAAFSDSDWKTKEPREPNWLELEDWREGRTL